MSRFGRVLAGWLVVLGSAQLAAASPAGGDPADPNSKPSQRTGPLEKHGEHEVESLRTARSKTYETDAAGEFRTEFYSDEIHFADEHGRLRDIDLSLERGADGRWRPKGSAVPVDLGDDARGDIARVGLASGVTVGLGVRANRSVSPDVAGDVATYRRAFANADLELHVVPSGVKDVIVLNDRRDAGDGRFGFDVQVPGGSVVLTDSGDIEVRDGSGVAVGVMPKGWMEDSSLNAAAGIGAVSEGVGYELVETKPGSYEVTVVADRDWLQAPERVFPVRIDPSVLQVGGQRDDTYTFYGHTTGSYHTSTELRSGTAYIPFRSFVHFGPFDVLDDPDKSVSRAQMYFYQTYAHSCTDSPSGVSTLELYDVTSAWGEEASGPSSGPANITSWSGRPSTASSATASVSAIKGCASDPGWVVFDSDVSGMEAVLDLVTDWVADPESNHGVSLKTANESSGAGYKKFSSADHSTAGTYNSEVPHINVTWAWDTGTARKADVAVFRPETGRWYNEDASDAIDTTYQAQAWGTSGDVPVYGDYDGDHTPDPAVYRPSTFTWYAKGVPPVRVDRYFDLTSPSSADIVPVPADFDGDGITDIAIFLKGSGEWLWRKSSSATGDVDGYGAIVTAQSGDVPIPADFNNASGYGHAEDIGAEPAIFRPGSGTDASVWYIRDRDSDGDDSVTTYNWGNTDSSVGDVPMPGNTWGTNKADIVVYRTSNQTWRTYGVYGTTDLGESGDIPILGDFDGDLYDERGVYTPTTGEFAFRDTSGSSITDLGTATGAPSDNDLPVQLAPAIRLAFFATSDPTPDPDSDIVVYGDDTYRSLGSTTSTGQTVDTASIDYDAVSGSTPQFPEWLPSGRIAIGTTQVSGNPVDATADGMHFGVFDPNGAIASGEPLATYQNWELPTSTDSLGIDGGADVADLCATNGRPLTFPEDPVDDIFGISSVAHLPASSGDGQYPTFMSVTDDDVAYDSGDPPLTWGSSWNTVDDLYDASGDDASLYPSGQLQYVIVNATSGTYTLTLGTAETDDISVTATAEEMRAKIAGVVPGTGADATVVKLTYESKPLYLIRLLGDYTNMPAPMLTDTPGTAADIGQIPDHGDGRSARMPAECEVLPNADRDIVITQYADQSDATAAYHALYDLGHAASATEAEAIMDAQTLSGRVTVLGRDGTVKATFQIPNMLDGTTRLMSHPRDLSVDPYVDDDGLYHFLINYDTGYVSFNTGTQQFASAGYNRFALQEFVYDDTAGTIDAISDPFFPPLASGSYDTRYNRAMFAEDGTVFAATAKCNPSCFTGEKAVAFLLDSNGRRPYEEADPIDPDGPWTVQTQPSAGTYVKEFALDSGILGSKAINYDEPTGTLILADWEGKITMLQWDGTAFDEDFAPLDVGCEALEDATPTDWNMSPSKATIDPVNRIYYLSYNSITSDSGAYSTNRSYLIALNLRPLLD